MSEIQATEFEVRCDYCDVSFPIGTKGCIHCGQRIGRAHPKAIEAMFGESSDFDMEAAETIDRIDEPEEAPRGRGFRLSFTMIWLLLAGISALVRSCQGQ